MNEEKFGLIETSNSTQNLPRHFAGLDSIRFFLAFCVVIEHFVTGNFRALAVVLPHGTHGVWSIVRLIVNNGFSGLLAVIGFFVVSGFCIHLPYAQGRKLVLKQFVFRREVRILLPLIAVFALGWLFHSYLFTNVLWSLVCEEIYYFLYPLLLLIYRQLGWKPIFMVSIVGAALVIVFVPGNLEFHAGGYLFTWILGLPIWLSGAFLAQSTVSHTKAEVSKVTLWVARGVAWLTAFTVSCAKNHMGVDFRVSAFIFAVAAFYWIRTELFYYETHEPVQKLECFGRATYSIYLVHLLAPPLVLILALAKETDARYWFCVMGTALVICPVFYFLVEKPSHQLAKRLSRKPA